MAQQVNIERIEQMPNFPQPYRMRNWKKVAFGYDSLVFDLQAKGEFLPLIWKDKGGINYPDHERFGIHSYVGTNSPYTAEGINELPAIIGASLVGIDKSKQANINWVLMSEEFFNNRPEENVYLNTFQGNSGLDWWYDTMPNIFFYQLYDLYPGVGDFERQFKSVADRWLDAVVQMGGNAAPWNVPDMDFRAWELSTMTGFDDGVKEPEAAGAIAWILYSAFFKTGNDQYRIGAEWALEFLNARVQNPAYELQLPYGVYIAARMNAELNTKYNIEKLLNWCFSPQDNVRGWGAVTGNWGGYDCDGLIGEAENEGYAFAMNGFEQSGALVPMVKYDERFARAIGKWILNIANASRLFYAKYLPDKNQDNEIWIEEHDKNSVIAYEALREHEWHSGETPYASGDAMRNNWGSTNLALYGSSHVGILGAIIDTTNISGILMLDANATDYFNTSFPTYLIYNPYMVEKTVDINLPQGSFDIYESLSNSFIAENTSQKQSVIIPADQAFLLVLIPTDARLSFNYNTTLANGVVIDYSSGLGIANYPPRIKSLASGMKIAGISDTLQVYCTAVDPDGDSLTYIWGFDDGYVEKISSGRINWIAPTMPGDYSIGCIVADNSGLRDSSLLQIKVINNHPPVIDTISARTYIIQPLDTLALTCVAHDDDGDTLSYSWKDENDDLLNTGNLLSWVAPSHPGYYKLFCTVADPLNETAKKYVGISVGNLVLSLPFNGSATDSSGYFNSGFVNGALLQADRYQTPGSAFWLDGDDDNIIIKNNESLNFQDEITVHFWFSADTFYSDKEVYPISHGNWENRWKISLNDNKLRWTIKTGMGVKDLDLDVVLQTQKYYSVTCTYSGSKMNIYLNGKNSARTSHSGKLEKTSYDLVLGQSLPGDYNYGFKGALDDIKLYNRSLTASEVLGLYDVETALRGKTNHPLKNVLYQNYPNPFNPVTTIKYSLIRNGKIKLDVYDINGRKVDIILNTVKPAGAYQINWNAGKLASGIYFIHLNTGENDFVKKIIKLK